MMLVRRPPRAIVAGMDRPQRPAPGRQADGSSDRRWVVITESGEWVTLSRACDPDEAEIHHAEDGLRRQGTAGWLAVLSGSRYAPELPTVLEVRPLAGPTRPFAEAVEAMRVAMEEERHHGPTPLGRLL
jgi:hypothetical protein